MPNFLHPIGWDGKSFRETFKTKDLPFLTTEQSTWDEVTTQHANRLIWGDNLAVMRSLPDECIDMIYIDPPFFSGRNYNCIFGDDDEVRTFSDIWDGGLSTYLAWLNARLFEMRRLLKSTGSIFVHLDWHAVHYVKVEMDKIFGYDNFRNDIIWHYYNKYSAGKHQFPRSFDQILFYSKTQKAKFSPLREQRETPVRQLVRENVDGVLKNKKDKNGNCIYRESSDKKMDCVWRIPCLQPASKEMIGYPTQKPENLIQHFVNAATEPGDVVADFFSGGGSTLVVAEKLGRRWIGCDISRIAVGVARDRLAQLYEMDSGIPRTKDNPEVGFEIQHHGAYDRNQVRSMDQNEYVDFILKCFGAKSIGKPESDLIHGYRDHKAIFVVPAKAKVTAEMVDSFHQELIETKIDSGFILAWGATKEAALRLTALRRGDCGIDIQIIQVEFVDIDSHEFKGDNIRFLNKPAAVIRAKHLGGCRWRFDATASASGEGED